MEQQKGYKQELRGNWWLKHTFFKRYMLREATVLPLVFFLSVMLVGVFSLLDSVQFEAWQRLMAHPIVIVMNILALIAAFYHAFTFFELFPRVMPIRFGDKLLPASFIVAGQWIAVVAVSAGFISLFLHFGGAQ
jgi:fumarate reductase subunit C